MRLAVTGLGLSLDRRFIIQRGHEHTRTGNRSRGGLVERPRVRRHGGPLCSKLVAAISGSTCIAVDSVSLQSLIVEVYHPCWRVGFPCAVSPPGVSPCGCVGAGPPTGSLSRVAANFHGLTRCAFWRQCIRRLDQAWSHARQGARYH